MATLEQQVAALQQQVQWLQVQLANVYTRLQIPYASVQQGPGPARTDVGMGPVVEPDKSSYV